MEKSILKLANDINTKLESLAGDNKTLREWLKKRHFDISLLSHNKFQCVSIPKDIVLKILIIIINQNHLTTEMLTEQLENL